MLRQVLVRSFEVRKTRNLDSFGSLRINLGREGSFAEVEAKVWGLDGWLAEGRALPAASDVLEVSDYKDEEYQGRPQWILKRFRILSPEERADAMAGFIPPMRIDKAFYQARLDVLIEQTSPERVCGIAVREIFDSAGFREAFCSAPAAIRHHQSYPGGLLEHTINVTSVALAIAGAYEAGPEGLSFNTDRPRLDRQVIIAAGLLHDIGKIETYRMAPLSEVTDQQAWEGHLAIGYAQVRTRLEPMMAAPPYPGAADEIGKLLNCILSHHGKLEYGSPTEPASAEAFILSQADMTDARLAEIVEGAAQAQGQHPGSRWLGRNLHFSNGVFVGDWGEETP